MSVKKGITKPERHEPGKGRTATRDYLIEGTCPLAKKKGSREKSGKKVLVRHPGGLTAIKRAEPQKQDWVKGAKTARGRRMQISRELKREKSEGISQDQPRIYERAASKNGLLVEKLAEKFP